MSATPSGRTTHLTGPDGTIRDWLVSPAWATPCQDLDQFVDPDGDPWGDDGRWVLTQGPDVGPLKERLAAAHPIDVSRRLPEVREGGPVGWWAEGVEVTATWQRSHTGWDGHIDWSAFCRTPEYRASIAATVVEVDQAEWRTIEVASTGPFVLWVGGKESLSSTKVSYMEPERHAVEVRLPSGRSTLHLATWQVAFRECRHVARVRVLGLPVRIVIPSPGASETVSAWGERILGQIGLESWVLSGDRVALHAPAGVRYRVRVDEGPWESVTSSDSGDLHVTVSGRSDPGQHVIDVALDDDRCPLQVSFVVAALPQDSRVHSHGTPDQWRDDVLAHVAALDTTSVPSVPRALARHHLDASRPVTGEDLEVALAQLERRGDCADFDVISLMLAWHGVAEEFWEPGLRDRVREAVTGMKYWITQPGIDAMCYFTENHQFVWHAAQHLVGSAFPHDTFGVDGRSGAEHAREGLARAAGWISRKLAGGYSEFDSNAYLAIDSFALVALIELSDSSDLRTAATTLLDKTLLTLASNAWRGSHGTAHGRSYVQTLRSSRFEETSPILRLIGGVGTLNGAIAPVTALALSSHYEIPDVVRALASEEPEEWWARQVYRGELVFERDLLARPYRSDLRVWRTPDVMLSSVQDYRSGLPGLQEHIWGATLGRECQVFITHPANADTSGAARPNAWAGGRVLPRVHQHRNVLVGLHRFTPSDPARRTHLWFPSRQFDDVESSGDWLFGRRDDGYVALATPGGFIPEHHGNLAHQEWHPTGDGDRWLVVVGRRAVDGGFREFRESLLNGTLDWSPQGPRVLALAWLPAEGPALELAFDGPFLVDSRPDDLSDGRHDDVPHLQNPAVTLAFDQPHADVTWRGHTMRLDIAAAIAAAGRAAP